MQYSHLKLGSFSQKLREIERGGIKKISRIFFCLNFFFFKFFLPLLPAMKASLNVLVFSRFNDPSRLLVFNPPLLKFCGGLGGSGLPNPALSRLGNDPVGAILL